MAGKRDSRRHSAMGFGENVKVWETNNQQLERFIILRPGKDVTFPNKDNRANVFDQQKSTVKIFGVSTF